MSASSLVSNACWQARSLSGMLEPQGSCPKIKPGSRTRCSKTKAGPATKFLAKSENKAGADSNRLRPPNLPRRINRLVRVLPCFLYPCLSCNLDHATLHARYRDRSEGRYSQFFGGKGQTRQEAGGSEELRETQGSAYTC